MHLSKQELIHLFNSTVDDFNAQIGTEFSLENVLLFFCTEENGIAVYESICKKHFQRHLDENYTADGFITGFAAMVLLGEDKDGILLREDVDFTSYEWHHTLLHELAHLFVSRNEIAGDELFYDKYCLHSYSGDFIAGYAIWRELIAEIIAMDSDYLVGNFHLADVEDELKFLDINICADNPEAKVALYRLLSYLFKSEEYYASRSEDAFIESLVGYPFLEAYESVIRVIYEQFQTDNAIKITPAFIQALGCQYLIMLAMRKFRDSMNM